MPIRRKVRYRGFGGHNGFDAVVTNTAKGIVFSDVVRQYYYDGADDMRNRLLSAVVPPYSRINPSTQKGRKELAGELEAKMIALKDEIEYTKLLIQMCKKKNVQIKTNDHARD